MVDDDRIQIEIAARILEKLGHQAASKTSGEEALEFLKTHPRDILIIDLVMPGGIDGIETFEKALNINPKQKTDDNKIAGPDSPQNA